MKFHGIRLGYNELIYFTLNLTAMKRIFWIMLLATLFSTSYGQKSIDALFDRYAGKDGFVTVTLNGDLLKLACILDDDDGKKIAGKITEIRVLAQEDSETKVDNFYDLVIRDINTRDYEEFMRVKESDQDLRMLVRTEGKRFKEFLLIAGGEDNVIVQVKGDLSLDDVEKISEDAKKDHGMNLF